MSMAWLKKCGIYQWTYPPLIAGRRFEVLDILEIRDEVGFRYVYRIEYKNYKYWPRAKHLDISVSFVAHHCQHILVIKEPEVKPCTVT